MSTTSERIGKQAKEIFKNQNQDVHYFISIVSLMEILVLSEKHRIPVNLSDVLDKIEKSSRYSVVELTTDIIKTTQTLKFYELHDRLILSTALWLGIPVISSDMRFKEVKEIKVIWD